jgi:hypothetical protein
MFNEQVKYATSSQRTAIQVVFIPLVRLFRHFLLKMDIGRTDDYLQDRLNPAAAALHFLCIHVTGTDTGKAETPQQAQEEK